MLVPALDLGAGHGGHGIGRYLVILQIAAVDRAQRDLVRAEAQRQIGGVADAVGDHDQMARAEFDAAFDGQPLRRATGQRDRFAIRIGGHGVIGVRRHAGQPGEREGRLRMKIEHHGPAALLGPRAIGGQRGGRQRGAAGGDQQIHVRRVQRGGLFREQVHGDRLFDGRRRGHGGLQVRGAGYGRQGRRGGSIGRQGGSGLLLLDQLLLAHLLGRAGGIPQPAHQQGEEQGDDQLIVSVHRSEGFGVQ